jgi:sulfate adenylyltransferase large subunit
MGSATLTTPEASFEQFLAAEEAKDLLRFTTAGSVDDGKSTLIGRLLYDSRNVYDDQLESVTKASVGRNAGPIDFSLLTDGLRAEREQGITIDVAYRYFSTPKRKFIIADTPGHEQYTRNMVTGASTAELAIILVDARKGLLPQSRRHSYISSLLGLPHLVIAVNKMDLVDYDEAVFSKIETDFRHFLSRFQSIEPYFIPISALAGDNVVSLSENTPWFHGVSLIEHLETVPVGRREENAPFRFPIQRIVRPDLDFRGYAGQISAGTIRPGDSVAVVPSGRTTKVKSIVTFDGELDEAHAPQSVTLTLEDEIDIVRGDLLSAVDTMPAVARVFDATIVWLNEQPLDLKKRYRLKHTSHQEWAEVKQIHQRVNINTLDEELVDSLEMNAIGVVQIETARAIYFDNYRHSRGTGSFILIDPVTNVTVAAGMIASGTHEHHRRPRSHETASKGPVTSSERIARSGHIGAAIHLGNRASLAAKLERKLFDHGSTVAVLNEWHNEWNSLFKNASILMLIVAGNEDRFEIHTAAGVVENSRVPLPSDDDEAVDSIYRLLETKQILFPSQSWTESAGI